MGVRPPTSDDEVPEVVAFGIAAIDARLEEADLTFPATAEEVVRELGGAEIPYDARGRTMALRDAVDECGERAFDTRQDLLNALHPVFEERRDRPVGIVDRMRSLIPF